MLKTALYQSDRHEETKKTYNNQPRSVRRLNAGKEDEEADGKAAGESTANEHPAKAQFELQTKRRPLAHLTHTHEEKRRM